MKKPTHLSTYELLPLGGEPEKEAKQSHLEKLKKKKAVSKPSIFIYHSNI